MVENRPYLTIFSHIVLLLGIGTVAFPIYVTFVASSHTAQAMLEVPIPLLPGDQFMTNLEMVLFGAIETIGGQPVGLMMWNSLVMAVMITTGKIAISLLSAYAIVYFKFPFRMGFFWIIFVTLMLPVEVRILPTFAVVANLEMLNTYWGLSVPLIASATATFLFRQFFMTVPDELAEAMSGRIRP